MIDRHREVRKGVPKVIQCYFLFYYSIIVLDDVHIGACRPRIPPVGYTYIIV